MLKVAVINVLKKNWLIVVCILTVSAVFQYWREHSVSPLMLFLVLLSSIAAGLLVALPVELHRLRNGRQ
ncbi:hypothetical protein ACCD08_17290 [Telluria sp. Tellsp104]|jgi:hypothetical protein